MSYDLGTTYEWMYRFLGFFFQSDCIENKNKY